MLSLWLVSPHVCSLSTVGTISRYSPHPLITPNVQRTFCYREDFRKIYVTIDPEEMKNSVIFGFGL
jgi:hypothetical protein